jgi:hypothetical protein
MAIASAGYSTRPLAEKLGYKAGQCAAFVGLPPELAELVEAVPFSETVTVNGWSEDLGLPRHFDLIHAFTTRKAELDAGLPKLQDALKRDGAIWVSWPKKAAKIPTDVTEDRVRDAALALDLVDVKVAAVDSVWSGLKLVIRKSRR